MSNLTREEVIKLLIELYETKTRRAIISVENYIKQAVVIPLVELRDGFDDFVMILNGKGNPTEKYGEAKSHFVVAGTEAWEEGANIKLLRVEKILQSERSKDPKFYSDFISIINERVQLINEEIINGRRSKSTDFDASVGYFRKACTIADETEKEYYGLRLPAQREAMEKEETAKRRRQRMRSILVNIGIAIASAVVAALISRLL